MGVLEVPALEQRAEQALGEGFESSSRIGEQDMREGCKNKSTDLAWRWGHLHYDHFGFEHKAWYDFNMELETSTTVHER